MMDSHISRSSILYGTSTSDTWHNLEQFQKDHIQEINEKLDLLDDEIWGKIILMERNKRIAKAYLRTTTVIVDGGCDKFDGKTIGFNAFVNHDRDAETEMIRWKINEGVAMKMDDQGNILAKANGMSPVFLQGLSGPNCNPKHHCCSQELVKNKGRLEPYDPNRDISKGDKKNRIVKIFDMKKFKADIEQHVSMAQQGYATMPNRKNLLLKSCVRIALVKNDDRHPIKSPCWFLLVNLVALDMLNAKIATLPNSIPTGPGPPYLCNESLQRSQHLSQSTGDLYGTLANPGGVITSAAASPLGRFLASQAGGPNSNPIVSVAPGLPWGIASAQDLQSFGVNAAAAQLQTSGNQGQPAGSAEHLAALANSIALGYSPNAAGGGQRNMWKPVSSGYLSETEGACIGNAAAMIMHRSRQRVSSEQTCVQQQQQPHSSGKMRPINQQCSGWGMQQSMDSLYEPIGGICISGSEEFDEEDCPTSAAAAAAAAKACVRAKNQKGKKFEPFPKNNSWSNGSTSDYESTKDIYDSSISSSSSRSSNSANGRSSPSIVSETASEQTSESGYVDRGGCKAKKDNKQQQVSTNHSSQSKKSPETEAHGSRHIALVTVHQSAKGPAPPPPRLHQLKAAQGGSSVEEVAAMTSHCSSSNISQSSGGTASPTSSTSSGEDPYSSSSCSSVATGQQQQQQQLSTKISHCLMRRPSRDLQGMKLKATTDTCAAVVVESSECDDSEAEPRFHVFKRSPPIPPHRRRKGKSQAPAAPPPSDPAPTGHKKRYSGDAARPNNKTGGVAGPAKIEVWNF